HLAGVSRDRAVLADVQPGSDLLRPAAPASALPPPAPGGRLGGEPVAEQQGDDDAAADDAEELAPVPLVEGGTLVQLVALRVVEEVGEELLVHWAPPFSALAACSMAATIRTYVPQRQTLPFIERTISSRLGRGWPSSSATADMIMPGV